MNTIRSEKNVVLVTSNIKEAVNSILNIVPVKAYDGKRSKNSTLMNLAVYLYKRILPAEDVREVIKQDFLKLSPYYEDFTSTLKTLAKQNEIEEEEEDDT